MQTLRLCGFLGILAVVAMCGCAGHVVVKDPVTRTSKVKDTSFERWDFAREVDRMIQDEQTGRRPPQVDLTWNAWWVDLIARQRKYIVGDNEFYVNYIITARHKAGLPELKYGR